MLPVISIYKNGLLPPVYLNLAKLIMINSTIQKEVDFYLLRLIPGLNTALTHMSWSHVLRVDTLKCRRFTSKVELLELIVDFILQTSYIK